MLERSIAAVCLVCSACGASGPAAPAPVAARGDVTDATAEPRPSDAATDWSALWPGARLPWAVGVTFTPCEVRLLGPDGDLLGTQSFEYEGGRLVRAREDTLDVGHDLDERLCLRPPLDRRGIRALSYDEQGRLACFEDETSPRTCLEPYPEPVVDPDTGEEDPLMLMEGSIYVSRRDDGRLLGIEEPLHWVAYSVSYAWEADRVISRSVTAYGDQGSSRETDRYAHDGAGRLVRVTSEVVYEGDDGERREQHQMRFEWSGARLSSCHRDETVVRYRYDEAGRLVERTVSAPDGRLLLRLVHLHDCEAPAGGT